MSWSNSWQTSLNTREHIKTEPDVMYDAIDVEESKEDLLNSQSHIGHYSESACSSRDLVSSRQDPPHLQIKIEGITKDELDNICIKEEMEE